MSDAKGKRKQVDKKLSYKEKCTGSGSNVFCFEITDKIPSQQYTIDSLIIFNVHQFNSLWQNQSVSSTNQIRITSKCTLILIVFMSHPK